MNRFLANFSPFFWLFHAVFPQGKALPRSPEAGWCPELCRGLRAGSRARTQRRSRLPVAPTQRPAAPIAPGAGAAAAPARQPGPAGEIPLEPGGTRAAALPRPFRWHFPAGRSKKTQRQTLYALDPPFPPPRRSLSHSKERPKRAGDVAVFAFIILLIILLADLQRQPDT